MNKTGWTCPGSIYLPVWPIKACFEAKIALDGDFLQMETFYAVWLSCYNYYVF